jgi:hypothetical protein
MLFKSAKHFGDLGFRPVSQLYSKTSLCSLIKRKESGFMFVNRGYGQFQRKCTQIEIISNLGAARNV